MARQFNFFAYQKDMEFVCGTLFSILSDLHVLRERGVDDAMIPSRVASAENFLAMTSPEIAYLIQGKDMGRIVFRPLKGGLKRVDAHMSSVMEYSPSHITESGALRVGRIMCACQNEKDLL